MSGCISDSRVWITRSRRCDYGADLSEAPELPGGKSLNIAATTLRRLLQQTHWDASRYGAVNWNPLGEVIQPGAKVVIKPNWVFHHHAGGHGLECLITHGALLEAVCEYVALARPSSIILGDAPIQACNFQALLSQSGVPTFVQRLQDRGVPIEIRDFRAVARSRSDIAVALEPTSRSESDYILFELADQSLLEPITNSDASFRVTMYDPAELARTHSPRHHQYLVAREVIEADVVVNVPKLKTHQKAGLTGALKNLVGVNGHKSFLPHHRRGSPDEGGDCYSRPSRWKAWAEEAFDRANLGSASVLKRKAWSKVAHACRHFARLAGHTADVEGSWHGNDTVWRMCLDLQRILHYGQLNGSLADRSRREVLHITDAIVAGEGNGPLRPAPVPCGVLTLARNAPAADWVHGCLMCFDPSRIPLTREAFRLAERALATFSPDAIVPLVEGTPMSIGDLTRLPWRAFAPPTGWAGACEQTSMQFLAEKR